MTIYEARGFQGNLVYPFDKIEPFQYIERFKTFTHKILYFRTVGKALPEIQATPEWRKAAANISRYIHG